MTYRGHVKNGQIVLEGNPLLPEGAEVEVVVVGKQASDGEQSTGRTLYERLKPFIGAVDGLPPDMSVNHDHYLYGTPKKE